jgi:hypothetical protein
MKSSRIEVFGRHAEVINSSMEFSGCGRLALTRQPRFSGRRSVAITERTCLLPVEFPQLIGFAFNLDPIVRDCCRANNG